MDGREFAELRIGLEMTQGELAKRLGVGRVTVARWETGVSPVPEEPATTLKKLAARETLDEPEPEPEIILTEPIIKDSSGDWREMTREERQTLPPGSPGWIYRPWDVLPKGQWIEVLDAPKVFENGAICTRIRWGSNGVGPPVMNLIGTTKDATPVERDGFDSLAPGIYHPMKPNRGDPAFLGKDKKK